MIDTLEIVSAEEASAIVARLSELRPVWVARDHARAFATLGRAAYLDLCSGQLTFDEYCERAAPQNEILRRHFGDLFGLLTERLSAALGAPAVLTMKWALPGFHIFMGQGLQGAGSGGAHFDLQFRALTGGSGFNDVQAISFTLAFELPEAGSGLRVWPIRPHQLRSRGSARYEDETLGQYLTRKPSVYVPYAPGRLYLQREPLLHCICNAGPITEADRRITLQGHGLEMDGQFVLYW